MAWYHAARAASEFWYGPSDTRDEAIAKGRARHGSKFCVAEGKPFDNNLTVFEANIAPVFDRFDSLNDQNFGEEGEGGPLHWDAEACADLSRRLNATFAAWATEHGYDRGWQLDLGDPEEIRPVLTVASAGACA